MAASGSVVGALRIVLGMDSAALEKDVDKAKATLASFAAGIATAGAAIAAAAAVAVGVAVKGMIDEADKLNKMSQSIGVPVAELSRLKYAADLSDVSLEALGVSVGKLSKNMALVAGGAVGPAADSFKALGISVTNSDGSLKSSSQVMTELAGKFGNIEDGAGKTALAMNIFGKAGASMIPLLNSGADGLRDMMNEADELGLVIDKKTSQAAENFNDNLTRLGKVKDGIILKITAAMLPALENLSKVWVDVAKNSGIAEAAGKAIGTTFQALTTVGVAVAAQYEIVSGVLARLLGALQMVGQGNFAKAWEELKRVPGSVADSWSNMNSRIATIWSKQKQGMEDVGKAAQTKMAAPIIKAAGDSMKALESFFNSTAKRVASLEAEAQSVGKTAAEHERLKTVLAAEAIAKQNNIPITDQLRARITALGESAAQARMKVEGANLTQQLLSPAEQYAAKLQYQQALFEAGAISADTYARAQEAAAQAAGASWDLAGASISGSFATIAGSFGKESSAMAKAAKTFGIIQGTISMYTGAAKALELPFPANIAAMAAVLAKGASLVASIKGQSVPTGFKTGGSFTVGGSGGADSQFVPIMATPGEKIDIWRPGEGGGDRRGAPNGPPKAVNVNWPGQLLGREGVRALFEEINSAIGDGLRLKLA